MALWSTVLSSSLPSLPFSSGLLVPVALNAAEVLKNDVGGSVASQCLCPISKVPGVPVGVRIFSAPGADAE